jgi:hypothetical protein
MKKKLFAFALLLVAAGVQAQAQKVHPDISSQLVKATVAPSVIKGPIKPMNAVNNGPNMNDDPQQMEDFRILNIPFSRTHDSPCGDYYGCHLVDISDVFPDFSKDPDKESSYDFRVNVDSFCGFYDPQTREHMPTYYVFYAWNKLRGEQCECTLEGGDGDIYAVAAVKDGKTVLMLTRYNGDNNACNLVTVHVSVKGYTPGEVVYCHLTDYRHTYTEIPLFPAEDGTVRVRLCNNSIAIVEF